MAERNAVFDCSHALPLTGQAEELGIARSRRSRDQPKQPLLSTAARLGGGSGYHAADE